MDRVEVQSGLVMYSHMTRRQIICVYLCDGGASNAAYPAGRDF